MEDLTKQQLVLLALLVSFVTSIATGIATVSLMDQAPPEVTQTIHKVVEKTVERVVPSQEAATVVTTEQTVVVKTEDAMAEAVSSASRSVVRISDRATEKDGGKIVALGFIMTPEGVIVTDSKAVSDGAIYTATLQSGATTTVMTAQQNETLGIALLVPVVVLEDGKTEWIRNDKRLTPATLGSALELKLGETVVALGGLSKATIRTGVVTSLDIGNTDTQSTTTDKSTVLASIETNISEGEPGTVLIDVVGAVIGIQKMAGSFVPISAIKRELSNLTATDGESLSVGE